MTLPIVSSCHVCNSLRRCRSLGINNDLVFRARQRRLLSDTRHNLALLLSRTFAAKITGPASRKILSRKEKRQQTRELKRQQKNGIEEMKPVAPTSLSLWRKRLRRLLTRPRMPGGYTNIEKDHAYAAIKRLPFFLVLAVLVTSDDTSPLTLDKALGPSMLPTIHPLGDLYLRETGAWHRALSIQKNYQVGHVIAIRNIDSGGYSCKRIIGIEGDEVLRYGQFAAMYKDRKDLGIVPPRQPDSYNLSWEENHDAIRSTKDITSKVTVPPLHVWVEGDNPLFSVDSRHFGPVPVESIRGRLLMRVWPLWRKEGVKPTPVAMSRKRPMPLTKDEALSVGYNLYRKFDPMNEKPSW